jgi:hypothetical protein
MHLYSQLGQTKVVFDNQGKNASQCVVPSIGFFLFKNCECMRQNVEAA